MKIAEQVSVTDAIRGGESRIRIASATPCTQHAARADSAGRLGYLVTSFPRVSETFITCQRN